MMIACRVNTVQPYFGLTGEADRLFDRFFGRNLGLFPAEFESEPGWVPAIDVTEDEKQITVSLDVPGVEPKDIEVTVSNQVLTIAGEKQESKETKADDVRHSERRFGSFRRTVRLPKSVDPAKIKAEHNNGVLLVRLNKAESVIPKRIQIEVANSN